MPRPRLLQQLDEGLTQKLILISAPAGFGKSTLVSSWLEHLQLPAVWLSLDGGDNDLARFFYLCYCCLAYDSTFRQALTHTNTSQEKLPIDYFVLVVILSIPFWIFGNALLPLPMALPLSSLIVVCPLAAAAMLCYREGGMKRVKQLLARAFDFKRIQPWESKSGSTKHLFSK